MNIATLIFILILILPISSIHTGTFTNNTYPISYVTTSSNPIINVKSVFTPIFSSVIAVISDSVTPPDPDRLKWIQINSKNHTNFDYEAAIMGNQQNAWIANPSSGTQLYIYLINFNNNSISYTITITQSSITNKMCITPQYYLSTFYCNSCILGFYGNYCDIVIPLLYAGDKKTVSIFSQSYLPFKAYDIDNINIKITSSISNLLVYYQIIDSNQHLAGLINYLAPQNGNGQYLFTSASSHQIQIPNNRLKVAIGIINLNSFAGIVTVQVINQNQSQINVILIVIAILAIIMLGGIVVIIIVIIKNSMRNQRMVNPQINNRQRIKKVDNNILTDMQIQQYFPTVLAQIVISPNKSLHEQSYQFVAQQQIKQQKNDQKQQQYECVICICSIEPTQSIKVGYCKHIFHSNCLILWFKKQQNCPYCRKDYSKDQTMRAYNILVKKKGGQIKGNEIIKQIFKASHDSTMQTLTVEQLQ